MEANKIAEAMVKLKHMLSYLTLYLILKHKIILARHSQNSLVNKQSIDSSKVEKAEAGLNLQNSTISMSTLREYIQYSRIL